MTKEKKDTKCDDLIDALLEKHGISPEAVLGENGLLAQLKKRVVERALAGELTHHLGYAKGEAPEEVDNHRNVLGIWIEQNEGAKFWLKVMNELRNRGVEDILIAVVDGLKGFPEAITTVFPLASVQTCIVHLSRYCLSFCGWKERQALAREQTH